MKEDRSFWALYKIDFTNTTDELTAARISWFPRVRKCIGKDSRIVCNLIGADPAQFPLWLYTQTNSQIKLTYLWSYEEGVENGQQTSNPDEAERKGHEMLSGSRT